MNLSNNTILITGGSSGYGLELARQLSILNNKVIICGRTASKLEEAREICPQLEAFQCDISQEADRQALKEYMITNHPQFNVLINNAAVVEKYTVGDDNLLNYMERELKINYLAPAALIHCFYKQLQLKSNAQVINISTGLVYAVKNTYPGYCASKSAFYTYSQILKEQTLNSTINVTDVFLPVVDTPFHKGAVPKGAISAEKAVSATIKELKKEKDQIHIGKVALLRIISRISPRFARKLVN